MVEKVDKRYEIGARFSEIRAQFCQNSNKKFAEMLGIDDKQASNYCGGTKKPGEKMIDRVLVAFPSVSRSWLVLGEGDMLIDNHPSGPSINTVNQKGNNTQNNGPVDVGKMLDTIHSQQQTIQTLVNMLNNK